MILVDLKKGIISMQGSEMTINAEVGIVLRRLHEVEKQNHSHEMADKTIDSLCKSAKLSDEDIVALNKQYDEECPFISGLADLLIKNVKKGWTKDEN